MRLARARQLEFASGGLYETPCCGRVVKLTVWNGEGTLDKVEDALQELTRRRNGLLAADYCYCLLVSRSQLQLFIDAFRVNRVETVAQIVCRLPSKQRCAVARPQKLRIRRAPIVTQPLKEIRSLGLPSLESLANGCDKSA
jgi:hypothetical protein